MSERFDAHMNDADALMWNIEKDPLLRSTIVTLLVLERAPDFDLLRERIERGSRLIPRLRQRVASPMMRMGPPHWSADPHFDIDYHLRRIRAPEPGDLSTVLDFARRAAMAGFDRARPLWEYTLVEGLEGDRAAFVIKVHHSMTDGVGGMKLLLMLFDLERNPAEVADNDDDLPELHTYDQFELVRRSLDHRRRRAMGIARRAVTDSAGTVGALRRDPLGALREAWRVGKSVVDYLKPATHPESPIMRARTLGRQLGTFDLPLADLKRAAQTVGASLNDVFVAGVAGGFQRYHELHGTPTHELRMVMPINVRADGEPLGGNHFTPARFLVPIDIANPVDRILEIQRRSRWIQNEPAVRLTDPLAGILNLLPTSVTTALFGAMLKGGDFVTSNVPGAPFPLYMAGVELERMYAFAPLSGTAANVTLLSHCGTCCIGINVDSVAVPDVEAFTKSIEAGFAEVLTLA